MPAARSLHVVCPHCNDGEELSLDLGDLSEITCGSCSETFSAARAVELYTARLARWIAVAEWINKAPVAGKDAS